MFRLLLLFTVVPLVELTLLLKVAEVTGWQFTIGLVLVTGVVGAVLAKWQGLVALQRIQTDLSQGKPPAAALFDGLLILVAGVVLITPGILTDAVGFALLLPPVRMVIRRILMKRLLAKFQVHASSMRHGPSAGGVDDRDRIIDVQVVDEKVESETPHE